MLLEQRRVEIVVLAERVVDADREVRQQLPLGTDDELIARRNFYSVVDAAGVRHRRGVRRIDASERANLKQLVALNRVIAVHVDTIEIERGIRERVRPGNSRTNLARVAVVAGPQQCALVSTERIRRTDSWTDGVPFERARIACICDRR